MAEPSRELTISPPSGVALLEQLNTVRNVLAPDLNPAELQLFAMVAERSGLDPFAKQIYAVKRGGRVTFQTGIDGYRSIAARTGMYDGQDEPEYGPDCPCAREPKPHPQYATVRVYRKDFSRPIAATAYFDEYYANEQGGMAKKMPRVMIAKVAEALALRKAFPYDPERRNGIGADLYTAEEMAQADRSAAPVAAPQPSTRDRIAARRERVEQPVARTDEGRAVDADGVIEAETVEVAPGQAAFFEPPAEPPIPSLSSREFQTRMEAAGLSFDADVLPKLRELFKAATTGRDLTPADWGRLAVEVGLA